MNISLQVTVPSRTAPARHWKKPFLAGLLAGVVVCVADGCTSATQLAADSAGSISIVAPGTSSARRSDGDSASLSELLEQTRHDIATLERRLEDIADDEIEDDIEDELEILEYLEESLRKALAGETSSYEAQALRVLAGRILDRVETGEADAPRLARMMKTLPGLLSTGVLGHRLSGSGSRGGTQRAGRLQARQESAFLYNPDRGDFYSPEELAFMTPDEISRIDVGPSHPAWHRASGRNRDPLSTFERSMVEGITAALQEDGDLPASRTWNPHQSRRVLFMEDIYRSATSAKGTTEDPYGVEWKIKWGDEVQAEPVSSRLYLLAGGKMTDLVYADGGGPDEMIMILGEPGAYRNEGGEADKERTPETVEHLIEVLWDFYRFDIVPYIHSHGTITARNAGTLLRHLPAGAKKDYRPGNLLGRNWISFREYSLELRPKGSIRNINGPSMADRAASRDRAARGLYLFSLWLSFRDGKDDNNKSYFVKHRTPGASDAELRISKYFEGVHDLGSTLGSFQASAEINKFSAGDAFLRRDRPGGQIVSRQVFLYKPKAWTMATWADSKWMARRIAGIPVPDLRKAVASSKWPDFMQEALVYKLVSRRNRIAEVYDLTADLDLSWYPPPHIRVNLGSPARIRAMEQHYKLAPGSLQAALDARNAPRGYEETLVINGQIADPEDSLLIRELVQQRFPSGLFSRYQRTSKSPPKGLELR